MKGKYVVFAILFVVAVLVATPALAAPAVQEEVPSDLSGLLAWLAGGGSLALVSWFVSWVLEKVPAWQGFPAGAKQLTILVVAAILGAVATYLMSLPPETFAPIEGYVKILLLVISSWLSTQVAHAVNPYKAPKG